MILITKISIHSKNKFMILFKIESTPILRYPRSINIIAINTIWRIIVTKIRKLRGRNYNEAIRRYTHRIGFNSTNLYRPILNKL